MTAGKSPRKILVLALGSPQGDDQVGWVAAQQLKTEPGLAPFVHLLSSPWDVVSYLEGGDSLIVIDAFRGGERRGIKAGSVLKISESELKPAPLATCSTHGGDLSEILKLARQLSKSPREVVVFAVAIEVCEAGAGLSGSASHAVTGVVNAVQSLLDEWQIEMEEP